MREGNSSRERGNRAREGEESHVGGKKRARGRVEARGEKLRPPCVCHRACVPPVFWGAYSNPNRPNWKPNRPHIGPVEKRGQPQCT